MNDNTQSNDTRQPIISGQTWKYVKPNPKNGKAGDKYVVTGTTMMKIGTSDTWHQGVLYMRLDAEGRIAQDAEPVTFCRDEDMFRKNFEFVPLKG